MINWKLAMHINGAKYHSMLYRASYKGKGIQMEIHTPVIGFGELGKSETYYFIDGDEREFTREEELMKALRELMQ